MSTPISLLELTLAVPSIEETIAWYERVLGWEGVCHLHGPDGVCLFGAALWQCEPPRGINLSRYAGEAPYANDEAHFYALLHVTDADAMYERVCAAGWPTLSRP